MDSDRENNRPRPSLRLVSSFDNPLRKKPRLSETRWVSFAFGDQAGQVINSAKESIMAGL